MQETIDKILLSINECQNPIKNTESCNNRDTFLSDISADLLDKTREEIECYSRNEDEASSLNWHCTRFVSYRII